MREEPFELSIPGGMLSGHQGGEGPPALLLHGGPAIPDYTEGLAEELAGLFQIYRYTQRGTPPSEAGPPYSIESHMADALAVLDLFGVERAWAIGHSWGAHLALHLLVAHPERLLGVVCVDALGAVDPFAEMGANMRRGLSDAQVARIDEIEARRRRGEVTEAELVERWSIVWPRYFADPPNAPPSPVTHSGVSCSIETNASIAEHFARGTLARGLPNARLPALFVHGELDPLPLHTATETAALIPSAHVETLAGRGHFPWLERPGEVRRAVERFLG